MSTTKKSPPETNPEKQNARSSSKPVHTSSTPAPQTAQASNPVRRFRVPLCPDLVYDMRAVLK